MVEEEEEEQQQEGGEEGGEVEVRLVVVADIVADMC